MKKLLLAVAVIFSFSAVAIAQGLGEGQGRQTAPGQQKVKKQKVKKQKVKKQKVKRSDVRYVAPHPEDHRGYQGRYNDRYPEDRYYWHEGEGRYYDRHYQKNHRWVLCVGGGRYRASPNVCVSHGGALYYW